MLEGKEEPLKGFQQGLTWSALGLSRTNLMWREAQIDAEWQQGGWGHEQEREAGGLT